jgi:hypothetical protein
MDVLARGPGPADPSAARRGAGFGSAEPFVIESPPGEGAVSFAVPVPAAAGHRVTPGDRLSYVCFPLPAGPPADEDTFYAATALALDVVFADGSRLSELGPRDQHGNLATPEGQYAARTLYVDQWNFRAIGLDAASGRVVERVIVRARRHPGHALTAFLDDVAIAPAPGRPDSALGWVRTTRGTHSSDRFSRGNSAPIVAVPHGGVFGIPMTDAAADDWPYAYHARPLHRPRAGQRRGMDGHLDRSRDARRRRHDRVRAFAGPVRLGGGLTAGLRGTTARLPGSPDRRSAVG